MKTASLGDPLEIRGIRIEGRIAAAPIATASADPEGGPTARSLDIYGRLARCGVDLVVVEHHAVCRKGRARVAQFRLDSDAAGEANRPMAALFREAGCPALVQINHAGSQIRDEALLAEKYPVQGPSEIRHPACPFPVKPREMDASEIAAVIGSYAAAAKRAISAGYPGVQVHACHGYLLSQFLSPVTNRRRDSYGGKIANRARLLFEIVEAVRPVLGNEGVLSVRLGLSDSLPKDPPEGLSLEDGLWVARQLGKMGIDHLGVSGNLCGYDAPGEGYFADWARAAREAAGNVPVTCTGGIRKLETARSLLESGACDIVGIGRGLQKDPDLVRKWKEALR
jgi:2,4-dienoyl-CoA reductase-like NADH-dependent reductase (Old Yellow Enzyme family)